MHRLNQAHLTFPTSAAAAGYQIEVSDERRKVRVKVSEMKELDMESVGSSETVHQKRGSTSRHRLLLLLLLRAETRSVTEYDQRRV